MKFSMILFSAVCRAQVHQNGYLFPGGHPCAVGGFRGDGGRQREGGRRPGGSGEGAPGAGQPSATPHQPREEKVRSLRYSLRPSYKRSLQLSKENIQHFKT
jgi:hypothetical protein